MKYCYNWKILKALSYKQHLLLKKTYQVQNNILKSVKIWPNYELMSAEKLAKNTVTNHHQENCPFP